jgi:hypothetical protein
MKRNLNKTSSKLINDFLLASDTGHIKKVEHKQPNGEVWYATETELFAHIADQKRVIAFLNSQNLDPFKRGTKEPDAIRSSLSFAKWENIKSISPELAGVRSMWD